MNPLRERLAARLRSRFGGARGEAGETLIETLLSTALLGIVVVAILGALATTVLSSKVHRQQADTNTALVAVMEHLKSPITTPRVRCAGVSEYQDEANTARDQAEAALPVARRSVVTYTIEYQSISGGALTWSPTCVDDNVNTLTLQRINLSATTYDSAVSPTLSFVKGDY